MRKNIALQLMQANKIIYIIADVLEMKCLGFVLKNYPDVFLFRCAVFERLFGSLLHKQFSYKLECSIRMTSLSRDQYSVAYARVPFR